MRLSSARLAPPTACTAMPSATVATKWESAAGSASLGRSLSALARFRRSRMVFSLAARRLQSSFLMHWAWSPQPEIPCTRRHPGGVDLSVRASSRASEQRLYGVPRLRPRKDLPQDLGVALHVAVERL